MWWLHNGYCMAGWRGFGMMVIFAIALIVGVVFLVRYARRPDSGGFCSEGLGRRETAEEILQKRFAKGELTRDEYRSMRDDLRNGS